MTLSPLTKQTALFGGRFDPPHLGHREAVRDLFQIGNFQKVVILPSAAPPHKPARAPIHNRIEMTRINFQPTCQDPSYPREVEFCLIEFERLKTNPNSPNFTFDTLQELNPIYPELTFVIGMDQLPALPRWHRFPDLLWQCHWVVLERKGTQVDLAYQTLSDWEAIGLIKKTSITNTWLIRSNQNQWTQKRFQLLPTHAAQISSTSIRKDLTLTDSVSPHILLPEVWEYLKNNQLYGTRQSSL